MGRNVLAKIVSAEETRKSKILERKVLNMTANGNMFYQILKVFATWMLRKRLADWTCNYQNNNIEMLSIYTSCGPHAQSKIGRHSSK